MGGCCDYIEQHVLDNPFFLRYTSFINKSIKSLGAILVFVVYGITALLTFTSFAIILPHEQWYQPAPLLFLYSFIGSILLVNIMFHYYKARTIAPIATPSKESNRWCHTCQHYKSLRTHHCGVCQRCVLGMDHHCIWINQCVGAHNHRHFFLFICNLTVASFIIVTAGFNSVVDHIFEHTAEHNFCNSKLEFAPLQGWICQYDGFARNSVIFTYFLSLLLMLLVGFLTAWNMFLISKGFTYIDYLRHSDMLQDCPTYRNPLNKGFANNWKNFLGLRRNRRMWRHVLLPSSHPPFIQEYPIKDESYEVV